METQGSNNIDVLIELNNGAYAHRVTTRTGLNVEVIDYSDALYVFDEEQRAKGIREAMSAPAPIDWAKEAARLSQLRDEAIAYLSLAVTDAVTFPDANGYSRAKRSSAGILVGGKSHQTWANAGSLTYGALLSVAAAVQKAIAGK
jgi:hypothetical protein